MPNSIAYAQNYVAVIDEVYQRAGVSNILNSGRRMVRAGHNAKLCPASNYPQPLHTSTPRRSWAAQSGCETGDNAAHLSPHNLAISSSFPVQIGSSTSTEGATEAIASRSISIEGFAYTFVVSIDA